VLAPAPAGVSADPAPAALAASPPLRPGEVFGVMPYWDLGNGSTFSLSGLTTVDYFGLNVNDDGSIQTSGSAWNDFLSQDFIDVIDRAHAAGDRVVLSITDFDQSSLDQLAASATAPSQLAQSILFLLKSRDLDGVNLDFEGQGTADQGGITNLVKAVSQTLKGANPDYQVTMDTYASAGAGSTGFLDLAALSPYVDAFMVMAYQLNLKSPPSSSSPMTSAAASVQAVLNEYTLTVPASKVILTFPLFGYDWPTTNGTLQAQAVGGPTAVTDAQEAAAGHPVYWDSVTDTAWTSYRSGKQWHEVFFEDPDSLFLASRMARARGLAGVGAWALGMDGGADSTMLSALTGTAPPRQTMQTGPPSKQASAGQWVNPISKAARRLAGVPTPTTTSASTTTTQAPPATSTSTTTTAPPASSPVAYTYSADWLGQETPLVPAVVPSGAEKVAGVISGFTTNSPGLSCLTQEGLLYVFTIAGHPNQKYVIANEETTGDCMNAAFVWDTSGSGSSSG
jgi:Glycosyl hydrolases family 18